MLKNRKPKATENNWRTRSGIDRRQFTYTAYIPERKSGKDRRKNLERINTESEISWYDRKQDQIYW